MKNDQCLKLVCSGRQPLLLEGGFSITAPAYMLGIPFWTAAPKSRCPVGRRGEFPDHPSSILLSILSSVLSSVLPSFLPSVLPSICQSILHSVHTPCCPVGHCGLKSAISASKGLILAFPNHDLAHKTSNLSFKPRISPLGLR